MSGYHVIVDGNTPADYAIAADVAMTLIDHYKGHPWHVNVEQGLIVVKHQRMSNKWGVAIKARKYISDAKVFKREIVMAAGQLLERAGLKVGESIEQSIVGIDGIPPERQGA